MKRFILALAVFTSLVSFSQKGKNKSVQTQPAYTPAQARIDGLKKREILEKNSLLNNIPFRNIGPSIMSGRVTDVDVNENNSIEFYVAFASGGLWHTDNNGISFTPVFDHEQVISIGDIAVDWKHGKTLWVGTGENNSSRSSYSGTGIFKSSDGGKTWEHKGLEESHHIGRIIIHPSNPNTLWVGSLGHLYTSNKERGVYKTTDGGNTWKQTLYVDENTGCISLAIDPSNPDVLYATMWQKDRKAWNFNEAGKGSGIYKSIDGGETWKCISTPSSGFPSGEGVGRIGIAVFAKNPNIIYSVVDNNFHRTKTEKKGKDTVLTSSLLKEMSSADFLLMDDEKINAYLEEKGFPQKYTARSLKDLLRQNKITVKEIADYTEDANSNLFQTPVIGAEVYRSEDGGASWKKMNDDFLDNVYYTYGYYFGQIWVSPADENNVFIAGVTALKSKDKGKTFRTIDGDNVHGDYHSLWIDPANPNHLIIGNDGGLNISYDGGDSWAKCNSVPVAQCYSVNVDMEKPYNVYTGLQDNNVWTGPANYSENTSWQQSGLYPFKPLIGGDGMQVQIDTRDNCTVYTGFQFGNYFKVNKNTGETKPLIVEENIGEEKLRWNWQSPILLSKHNQDILYFGSNKFHRSLDKGETFKTLSNDLTNGKKEGDVSYGTLTTIDESPLRFGLLVVGTDDGNIQLSKDGGYSWTKISGKLPPGLWVSRVTFSAFSEGRIYASLNGYRNDDFNPYLFLTEDYGATWIAAGTDLPAEPINVVKEDPENENIIYAGTDNGLYVSLDKGKNFMRWNKGLPNVAVHDLVIHPRDHEIVLGTHGRSIYIADVKLVQQLNDTLLKKSLYIFTLAGLKYNPRWGAKNKSYAERPDPSYTISYYAKDPGIFTFIVKNEDGSKVNHFTDTAEAGINYVKYDLLEKDLDHKSTDKAAENGKFYVHPGRYSIEVSGNATNVVREFAVKEEERRERRR